MNFDFSDDSKLLREQAQRFLREHCTPKAVRHVLEGHAQYSAELWRSMAEMGWLGAAIPEAYDGAGLGYEALCVLAEELGRVLAPVPFASTVCLAAEAILAAGTEAQKRAYLPKIVRGELIATFALAEGAGEPREAAIRARFSDGRITGSKWPVPDGSIAQVAVVAVRDGSGVSLAMVDLAASGVNRSASADDRSKPGPCETRFRQRAGNAAWRVRTGLGGRAKRARPSRNPGRVRAGGWGDSEFGDGNGLCEGSVRIRPADRLVPGDQAQAGRCLCRHRTGAVERVLRGVGAIDRTRRNCRWQPPRHACRRPMRSGSRRKRTSRCMAASASPGTMTATCSIAAPSCWRCRSAANDTGKTAWSPNWKRATPPEPPPVIARRAAPKQSPASERIIAGERPWTSTIHRKKPRSVPRRAGS